MKYRLLLLIVCTLGILSCGDDLPITENTLQLDGSNDRAPILNAGDYEAAVYFSASTMRDFEGRQLRSVDFNLYELPSVLEVVIYGEGSRTQPGQELYREEFTSFREQNWNTHVLSSPLTLDGNPIWISTRFTTEFARQIIGCDAGPRNTGGDHFYSSIEGAWTTYGNVTGESINWNIRGNLVPL